MALQTITAYKKALEKRSLNYLLSEKEEIYKAFQKADAIYNRVFNTYSGANPKLQKAYLKPLEDAKKQADYYSSHYRAVLSEINKRI